MAFSTNTLVNGQWTSATLDVTAVLQHYDEQDREANANANANTMNGQRAPMLGLLTQTALQSPLVHWVLPVRLRNKHSNDVAFIGDNFVQIKELRQDGLLWDIVQKNNFGARIRNACVIGPTKDSSKGEGDILSSEIKEEFNMEVDGNAPADKSDALPPQALLLQLDTGDSLFLMLRQNGSSGWDFVSSRQRVSKPMLMVQPGMHLSVDPSSRYVAVGCSEGIFAIYALNSREELERQHENREPIRYIKSERYLYIRGVLHKMLFLYPSPDDDKHIILLLLVVFRGRTRMQLYEWAAGCDLREVRPHNQRGHLLEPSRQLPLLLIPLTIKSRFLLVSGDSISVCKDILHGYPVFSDSAVLDAPTHIHQGPGSPLWTAWTRPLRLPHHTVKQDDVYLVREDGLVKYLEMTTEDDDLVEVGVGTLEYNCGKAFTCLDYNVDGNTGDLLVTGGDSCPGATYAVLARKTPVLREIIPNWSPALDIVTTSRFQDHDGEDPRRQSRNKERLPRPDRIFACIGKGSHGAITEFRHGLEARLGLETEFSLTIIDAWVAPSSLCRAQEEGGSLFLLSLADRSALLYLSGDGSEINELDQLSTSLDLRYRTLATSLYDDYMVQVTQRSIFVIHGHESHAFDAHKLLEIHDEDNSASHGSVIDDAVTRNSVVVFTTHFQQNTYVKLLDLRPCNSTRGGGFGLNSAERSVQTIRRTSSSVTSLAICTAKQTLYAIVVEVDGSAIDLKFYPVDGGSEITTRIPSYYGGYGTPVEGIISICVCSGPPGLLVLVCGTRNGSVICLRIRENDLSIASFWSAYVGATSVKVKTDETVENKKLVFMTCDSKLYSLNVPAAQYGWPTIEETTDRRAINHIWLTDATNPYFQQPRVTTVATVLPVFHDDTSADLLVISGSRLLLTNLNTKPKPVPRTISIGGTPTRLVYSQELQVLIVAAVFENRSVLLFIDPDTGEDLSRPSDKKGRPVKYVAGLGERNGRIYRLLEWSYTKNDKTWSFIVACTNTGRLLIMSVEREEGGAGHSRRNRDGDVPSTSGIRFFTRYKFKCPKPVYSVAGFTDGLLYCAGTTLFCDRLNLVDKRFDTVARYELPSAAVDITFDDNKIYATTIAHSLEVLTLARDIDGTTKIIHAHGDQLTRNSLHHRLMGMSSDSSFSLVSDKSCTVVGLSSTINAKADVLDLVFEAQLSHSILRFRGGNYRPIWDPTWDETRGVVNRIAPPPFQKLYSDVLGLSIDGSLHHFTIIDFNSWRVLRFIQNLAMGSSKICEFTYTMGALDVEPEPDSPTAMHIDGDILSRIGPGDLEALLRVGDNSDETFDMQDCFSDLVRSLHPGRFHEIHDISALISQAYKDLGFFLRPVL